MKIGFLGIDHLSLNYGAAAADKGFDIFFYDSDPHLVRACQNLELDYSEPGLKELLRKNKSRLTASGDAAILKQCDLLYVAKDVPTDDLGNSDLSPIDALCQVAIEVASSSAILAVLCQVPPGYTRAINFPKERLFYQLDTLIFGKAVERALFPERYVIGCDNINADLPTALQQFVHQFDCPVFKVRYESAELTKIAMNLFLISSVTTTNLVAEVCEKIGADWFEIQETLRCDKRIGKYAYLNPGLGIAGGNLERSLKSIAQIAYEVGAKDNTIQAWIDDSAYRKDWALKLLHQKVFPNISHPSIGILGIAYKENTSSVKNSPSLHLMKNLQGYNVKAFDPAVEEVPYSHVQVAETAQEVCQQDILLVMTPWNEFKKINFSHFPNIRYLIDPYNVVQESASKPINYNYYCMGRVTC